MAANHVLLQVLQRIDLALDRSFVQHLGRLLEGSGRNEARSLQCGTGDTLQNLRGSRRNDITLLDEIQVTTLEARILITQLAHRDNLPRLYGRRVAGIRYDHLVIKLVVHVHKLPFIDDLILEEAGITRIFDLDFRHHLAYDHLEMLVVDLHALHTVHLLHLIDDVLLHLRQTQDIENIARGNGTVRKRTAGLHVVVLLNDDLTRQRHQVTAYVTFF